jgi:4-carboxymuconolactone decarboxylase
MVRFQYGRVGFDLSRRIAEFNIPGGRACPPRGGHDAETGVCARAATIEKQGETGMRLKLLSPGEMSAEQKETYDESIAGKRGAPPAPMMAWLNSPEMAKHATRLGEVMRFNTMFPAKLSEIAILVTARHWTSHYEWFAHKRLALKGGMDPKVIDDIRDRRTPSFDDPKGKTIYELAKSLHEGRGVSKTLYDEAVKVLTERGVTEVIGLCGYYTLVSMTLNTFEFGLPDGEVSDLA